MKDISDLILSYIADNNGIHTEKGTYIGLETLISEYSRVRAYLKDIVSPGDRIGLYLNSKYRYLLAQLACMELGITYVPMRVDWPVERVLQIRGLASLQYVFIDEEKDDLPGTIFFDNVMREAPVRDLPGRSDREIDPEHPLYIMFTSGSTGEPKGVIIPRRAFLNFSNWIKTEFAAVERDDRILAVTDFTFDISLVDIILLLHKKCDLYFSAYKNNVFVLLDDLVKNKITFCSTVPNNYSMFLYNKMVARFDLSHLMFIVCSGAIFSHKLYENMHKVFTNAKIYNGYGPTEMTVFSTVKEMTGDEGKDICNNVVSAGTVLPGCYAKIVNEKGIVEGDMATGELYLGGEQLMEGYINSNIKRDDYLKYFDGEPYYRTGDLVFRNKDGEYFVIGRADDTIKVSGCRVCLSNIEHLIKKLSFVRDCVMVNIPHEIKENILVLFVILDEEMNIDQIFAELKKVLVDYQIPQAIRIVDSFPVNNSQKVSKKKLVQSLPKEVSGIVD